MTKTQALEQVASVWTEIDKLEQQMVQAIRQADDVGVPMHHIADAANTSPDEVRRVLSS